MQTESMAETGALRLPHFTISFFSIVLGFSGLSLALLKLSEIFEFLHTPALILTGISLFLLALMAFFYLLKAIRYPHEVKKEFFHPVKMNFFPLWAKIFLIHSVIFLGISREASFIFWLIGTAIQTLFIFVILSLWIRHTRFEIHHMNPAWFMPVVGAMMIPITGVEHAPKEVSWFFFAVGVFLWLSLFAIVLYRMIFHSPLPEKLLPTLFILFAPPAIGFIAYFKLTGGVSDAGTLMYFFSLFLLALVLFQVGLFAKIPFFLSWWAYSFPLAAVSVASTLMHRLTGKPFYLWIAGTLVGLLTLIILFLSAKTLNAAVKKQICREEKE